MNSLKPVLGTGAETCHFQDIFNYVLMKDIESEEIRL